jgi:hypothetical protein
MNSTKFTIKSQEALQQAQQIAPHFLNRLATSSNLMKYHCHLLEQPPKRDHLRSK